MTKKLDRRTAYTRMVIKESLYKLLEKKHLSEITVKELCAQADINRTTFYRNYMDIYDLYDNNEFTSQDEVDEMAIQLKILEDACRKIDKQDENKKDDSSNKKEYKRTSPATGDNASLVVMSIILVSSIGLAFVSIKRRKRDF